MPVSVQPLTVFVTILKVSRAFHDAPSINRILTEQ